MKDYYDEFLRVKNPRKGHNVEVPKVSKVNDSSTEHAFDTFDASLIGDISKKTAPSIFNTAVCSDPLNTKNSSAVRAVEFIREISEPFEFNGDELLLNMPTLTAYRLEFDLQEGVMRHYENKISDSALKQLARDFVSTHLRGGEASTEWTGKDVQLFYASLFSDKVLLDSYTCNQIQLWIIREYWLRTHPALKMSVIKL